MKLQAVSFVNEFSDLIENKFTSAEIGILLNMLSKKINSPVTSSAGRLFDAVSSLLGICDRTNYEGQAAMMLEFAADLNENGSYPFEIKESDKLIIDWQPIIISIINDIRKDVKPSIISTKFHNTLSQVILEIAKKSGMKKVILSGGCFQNALLTERTISLLQENNYKVYWHQRIPPNDGGIALGQIAAYMMQSKSDSVGKNNHSSKTEKENQLTKEIS